MQEMIAKFKNFIAWTACLYGFLASSYFLAWHIGIALSYGSKFDLDSYGSGFFTCLALMHAAFVFLVFLEREETDFRWGTIVEPREGLVVTAQNILLVALYYFLALAFAFIAVPFLKGRPMRSEATSGLLLTSLFLLQTLFIGFFFLVGKENLLSPKVRAFLDWTRMFRWLRIKIRRTTPGGNKDGT